MIDHYRLGFDITPSGSGSTVRILIDYALPQRRIERLYGLLLGDYYAKWCTRQMLRDVIARFTSYRMEQKANRRTR